MKASNRWSIDAGVIYAFFDRKCRNKKTPGEPFTYAEGPRDRSQAVLDDLRAGR